MSEIDCEVVNNQECIVVDCQVNDDTDVAVKIDDGRNNDHRFLTGRDVADQHPISAITNLQSSLDAKANQSTTYTKTEVDTALNLKADKSTTYTKTETDTLLSAKQNTLTAGANIQINNNTISATDTTYTAGTGIDITNNVISNTQTSAEWGNITGTLSSQTDLQTALNAKANSADLATVATTGSYNDLSNKPTIPTVNDGTITITQGGVTKGTFTVNQSGNTTISLDSGGSGTQRLADGTDIDTLVTEGRYYVRQPTSTAGLPNLRIYNNGGGTDSIDVLVEVKKCFPIESGISDFEYQQVCYFFIVEYGSYVTDLDDIYTRGIYNNGQTVNSFFTNISNIKNKWGLYTYSGVAIPSYFYHNTNYLLGIYSSSVPTRSLDSLDLTNIVENTQEEIKIFFQPSNSFALTAPQLTWINQATPLFKPNVINIITIKELKAELSYVGADYNLETALNAKQATIDSSHKLSSNLVDDTNQTNKFVTSAEKTTWNNKSDFSGSYNDLTNKPTIPTKISDLTDDTSTNPINKADTLTGLTATVSELNVLDGITTSTAELNYTDGVTSNIQTQLNAKENTSNKVTTIDDNSTDTQYPSAKCVMDNINDVYTETDYLWEYKQDVLVSQGEDQNIKTINGESILGTGNINAGSSWGAITGTLSNQTDLQTALNNKLEVSQTESASEIDVDSTATSGSNNLITSGAVYTGLSGKQDTLVSGTNIKTINSQSILGSGNITIQGGGGTWGSITGTLSNQTDLQSALNAKQDTLTTENVSSLNIDTTVTSGSSNLITSGAVNTALSSKQNTLTAGNNITINGNTISATDTTYTAGTGISITNNVISNTQTSAQWGNITGTLSNQTDLQTALNAKQDALTIEQTTEVTLATVATSGSYNDLTNKPTIPTVNDGILTIQKNSTTIDTFTANSSTNKTVNITVPTNNNELTNGAGYQTASDVSTAISGKQDIDTTFSLTKNGNTIILTTKLPNNEKLVRTATLNDNGNRNKIFNFSNTVKLNSSNSEIAAKSENDDIAPLRIMGQGTISSNHGYACKMCNANGQTTADVGSQWTDGTTIYVLGKVENNKCYFLSPYSISDGRIVYTNTTPVSNLIHVSGATHTGTISIEGVESDQCTPSVNKHNIKILCNNKEITADGIYYGDEFVVLESYGVLCYGDLVDYLKTHIGNEISTVADNIGEELMIYNKYIFDKETCVIQNGIKAIKKVQFDSCGVLQAVRIGASSTSGMTAYRYMDAVKAKNGFDLKNIIDLNSYNVNNFYYSEDLVSTTKLPTRTVDIAKNSNNDVVLNFSMGFFPDLTQGSTSNRLTNIVSGYYWDLRSTKKNYANAIYGITLTSGQYISLSGYRSYITQGIITNFNPVKFGDSLYVFVDCHSAGTYTMQLDGYAGCEISVVDSLGITLNTDVIDSTGICFTSESYGTAVFKVSGYTYAKGRSF